MTLAITGASGHIGGMVTPHISTRGLPLILPDGTILWAFIHNCLGHSR